MKILHINCNYTGNKVHRTMISHLSKYEELDNYVFAPVSHDNKSINDKSVIVSECFKKWNRFVFNYKSNKIRKALEENYDVPSFNLIHSYTLFTDGNVAYNLNKKYNIPYVVAIRNTDVNTFFKYMIHLRRRGIKIMKNASAIFFLSDSYKKIVFNKYVPNQLIDELNNKTFIIPNGIDDFWINNRFINKKKKNLNSTINIIYAGIIDANKNIETTQKALEKIRNQGINTNFTVVGKIGDTKIYNRLMKYPNTKYYQNMTKEELLKLYRKNDIFVMPSITETFGLVYAEAMSQGLPIIYTRNQGFDGQFDDGVVGFSVDSKSCNEIAFKILRIINCYESMSDNCINYCRKFDWNGICQIYFDLYYSLLR